MIELKNSQNDMIALKEPELYDRAENSQNHMIELKNSQNDMIELKTVRMI